MRLKHHIAASVPLGLAVGWFTASPAAGFLSAVVSVLVDLDHLLDYLLWRRGWRGFDDFFTTSRHHQWPTGIFAAHCWELLPILALTLTLWLGTTWALAITAGWAWHLLFDQLHNKVLPLFYFFCFRASRGFQLANMLNLEGRRQRAQAPPAG